MDDETVEVLPGVAPRRRRVGLALCVLLAAPACGPGDGGGVGGPRVGNRIGDRLRDYAFTGYLQTDPGDASTVVNARPFQALRFEDVQRVGLEHGTPFALVIMALAWCLPCQDATKHIAARVPEAAGQGGMIVEVLTQGFEPQERPTRDDFETWITGLRVPYTSLLDGETVPRDPNGSPTAAPSGPFGRDFWDTRMSTRSGIVVDLRTLTVVGDQFDSHITGEARLEDFYTHLAP